MLIRNGDFKSTADEITVSAGAKTSYLVLKALVSANKYYVKKMSDMQLGDTVYVVEDATVASDRWLSEFTSSPLSGVFKALNEKIDLSNYALKTEAGKAGSYTVTYTGNTGNAGAETAVGAATVTYKKAAEATGSAGGATITSSEAGAGTSDNTGMAGNHTISGASFSFSGTQATITVEADAVTLNDHSYQPAGTISAVTAAAHSHTVNVAKATITNNVTGTATGEAGGHTHSVSVSGNIALGELEVKKATSGTVTYTPAGTISEISNTSHTHTITLATATIQPVIGVDANTGNAGAHSHTVATHDHADNVSVVTGYPNFSGGTLTGTKTFNTDAIKNVTLSAGTVSTDGPAYLEDVSHTAASLTGDTTFVKSITNWNGGTLNAATAKTVVTGVTAAALTGTTSFNTDAIKSISGTKNFGFAASTSVVNGWSVVEEVLSLTTVTASTQDAHTGDAATKESVGISGGVASGTISVVPSYTLTAATATITGGSVGISGGSISKTTKYMKRTLTAATTGTVGFTAASLGAASIASVAGEPAVATLTSSEAAAHSHTVGSSKSTSAITYATGAVNSVSSAGAFATVPTFTGTGARLYVAGGTVSGSMSGTAQEAGAHTHSLTNSALTYVTGATTTAAGTINVTPTFTGTAATLAHEYTDAASAAEMSGSYQPAGTIGGSVTIASHSHSYTKPTAHTHSVTVSAHTHSISLNDATVTGSVSVAVSNHSHTMGHSHTVTIPNCK